MEQFLSPQSIYSVALRSTLEGCESTTACISGDAVGSDQAWVDLSNQHGIPAMGLVAKRASFQGPFVRDSRKGRTQAFLLYLEENLGCFRVLALETSTTLKRNFVGCNSYVQRLLLRDILLGYMSSRLYAVGELLESPGGSRPTSLDGIQERPSFPRMKGGTAWGVSAFYSRAHRLLCTIATEDGGPTERDRELGRIIRINKEIYRDSEGEIRRIIYHLPLYLYEQVQDQWYQAVMVRVKTPSESKVEEYRLVGAWRPRASEEIPNPKGTTGVFAGIGTRNMEDSARDALEKIFLNSH